MLHDDIQLARVIIVYRQYFCLALLRVPIRTLNFSRKRCVSRGDHCALVVLVRHLQKQFVLLPHFTVHCDEVFEDHVQITILKSV